MAVKSPPGLILLPHLPGEELLARLRSNWVTDEKGRYLPFDELRYCIKKGENVDVAWTLTRLARNAAIQWINYCNKAGEQAGFNITPVTTEACELVDKHATAPALKDWTGRSHRTGAELNQLRLEEPITSSQLEGTNTITLVAREMLEIGRLSRAEDEHITVRNVRLMAGIPYSLAEPLAPALVRQLYVIGMGGIDDAKHRLGELRGTDDVVIADYDDDIVHQPSAATLLPERLKKVRQWLDSHEGYVHPLVRAYILHFMLVHEHPFRDGNGRTNWMLLYWYIPKSGYDVFKYISISSLFHTAPVKYVIGYQYTKSDGMDLTYFLEYQVGTIKRALQNWQQHIDETTQRGVKFDSVLLSSGVFKRLDPRQITLLNVMPTSPGEEYTVAEISVSLSVLDNTAWAGLRTITKKGFVQEKKANSQQTVYVAHYPLQPLPVDS